MEREGNSPKRVYRPPEVYFCLPFTSNVEAMVQDMLIDVAAMDPVGTKQSLAEEDYVSSEN